MFESAEQEFLALKFRLAALEEAFSRPRIELVGLARVKRDGSLAHPNQTSWIASNIVVGARQALKADNTIDTGHYQVLLREPVSESTHAIFLTCGSGPYFVGPFTPTILPVPQVQAFYPSVLAGWTNPGSGQPFAMDVWVTQEGQPFALGFDILIARSGAL